MIDQEEIIRCRVSAKAALKTGIDATHLQGVLEIQDFSAVAIETVLDEYKVRYVESQQDDNVPIIVSENQTEIKESQPIEPTESVSNKFIGFIFNHYLLSFFIFSFLILLILAVIDLNVAITVAIFVLISLPKALIFAVTLKIFSVMFNIEKKISWSKAIIFGFVFSLVPLSIPAVAMFWWVDIPLIVVCIIPLITFFDMDFKQALLVTGIATMFALVYQIYLGILVANMIGVPYVL